ncbi:YjfB family protein [Clostridium sp. SHJSY1]|uniref:YjfB family protein n=1 Tax=Clostridium sp. SHJSY1 TaxID=2942483 RepID=UPI002874EC88|nr:YjfB family protein [Clostridium sp. SHJSY1]MDS0527628.1 YjfB family protein [Clostridium sp. SHJSY1]
MDIAALSMYMSQSSIKSAVSTSVLKMAMDNGKEMASEMTSMMGKMAVDTSKGMNLDVRA